MWLSAEISICSGTLFCDVEHDDNNTKLNTEVLNNFALVNLITPYLILIKHKEYSEHIPNTPLRSMHTIPFKHSQTTYYQHDLLYHLISLNVN